MIARCDAVENYMFLRDSQLMYWIVIWGGSQEFYIFRTGSRLKNLTPNNRQHKGMTNSEMEMCIRKETIYLEAAFLEDEMSTTLRVRSSGSTFR